MPVSDVAELRDLLRQSASEDRTPEEWLLVAFPDAAAVLELLPLLRLAEEGSRAQRLLAEHVRFCLGKHLAASLELLEALERTYELSGPIADESLSTAEAAEIVQRLSAAARGDEARA